MNKNFYYRFLLITTFITGFLFIGSVPEASNSFAWICLGTVFVILYFVTYRSMKNLSEDRINEILMVDKFKKFGIDINED